MRFYASEAYLDSLILEDCPGPDLTVDLLGIGATPGELACWPKEDCVLAGVEEAALLWRKCGANVELTARNGERRAGGEVFLRAFGTAAELHRGLKIAQNVMEYMSGIATRTADMLERARAANPAVRVAVTRKNVPGAKRLCLEAAVSAGADIHRLGLSESVLIFDQHRVFLGKEPDGAQDPVARLAARVPSLRQSMPEKKLAAEVANPEEALLLAEAGVDIIQCEKFSCPALAETVRRIRALPQAANPQAVILAAGGVNGANAADYAATGVDGLVTSWVYYGRPADIKISVKKW